jgi:hypothetical protein
MSAVKTFQKVDWAKVDAELPTSQAPKERKQRQELFEKFDATNCKKLTLTQVMGGLGNLFDKGTLPITDLRPAIKCAFTLARNLAPQKKRTNRRGAQDTNVDPTEFHALLCAFRQYLELQVLFVAIDTDGDAMLSLNEAKGRGVIELLEKWGLEEKKLSEKFPKDKWAATLDFESFAEWCLQTTFKGGMDLKLDDSDNEDVVSAEAAHAVKEKIGFKEGSSYGASLEEEQNKRMVREAFNEYDTDKSGTISKDELSVILKGLCDMSDDEIAALFKALDVNEDGELQFEEFVDWIFSKHETTLKKSPRPA